jgi:DNA-binding transcriptional ArsR family regulator
MKVCSCNCYNDRDFKKIESLAKTAKYLSSRTKLKILHILFKREHCVCEIEKCIVKEQSLVSHHLADLVESGWIRKRKGKDARQVFYSLTDYAKKKLKIFFEF